MVFVSTEYCVCDDLVCCVNVGDGLCVGNDVFYFVGEFCPVCFVTVSVRLSVLLKFEIDLGVDL